MNYKLISKFFAHFLGVFVLLMLPSMICSILYHEWYMVITFLASIVSVLILALILHFFGRNASSQMYEREMLVLVSIGWMIAGIAGSLPFLFSGLLNPVDSLFESISGLTTTGSSVMTAIEEAPKGLLFWRAFIQWIGGMGIVLIFITVLPYLGAGGKHLMQHESYGINTRSFRPRIKESAIVIFKIYMGMTILMSIMLMMAGMSVFDAICHAFTTLATGGYSTRQASIAAYDSQLVELILIFGMVLASINFVLFFGLSKGDWRNLVQNTEWKVFLAILAVAILLITLNLMWGSPHVDLILDAEDAARSDFCYTPLQALRAASFNTISAMSTTGFATDNFDSWPHFSRMLLIFLMIIGGCTGSTSGGIKVMRVVLLIKMLHWKIENTYRPKTVRAVRLNGEVVPDAVQQTIYNFITLYILVYSATVLLLSAMGLPFITAISAVAATINGVGPGMEHVGAIQDFHLLPNAAKLLLSLVMIMGRLEIFSVCALFLPSFWRKS